MEWDAPAIVLEARPYGEADALATVLTEAEGRRRGLVRGGRSGRHAASWQVGNLIQARWSGRLAEQLGGLTGELVHPAAALVFDDALLLAVLASSCSIADGALPEREPHPRVFRALLSLIAHLAEGPASLVRLIRWEADLLSELGYGLDLSRCAVTGTTDHLGFVSPRSGRAVGTAVAGEWAPRLLPLPHFLADPGDDAPASPAAWRDGLRLTGHFLARDAFGSQHRPLPAARLALFDRVERLALTG